jgi:hypothetical protein
MTAIGKLEKRLNKAVVAYFKFISQHFLGGTEENRKKPQSRKSVSDQ